MSEENKNLPSPAEVFPADFLPEEQELFKKFRNDGMPGISSVSYEMEKRMESMYMEGYTYKAISLETRQKKAYVLTLAYKNRWHTQRSEKMGAMADSIYKRRDIFKSENEHFLINFCDTIKGYYSDKMKEFKDTRDPSILDSIDPKLINLYLKCLETLSVTEEADKNNEPKNTQQTLVNVQGDLNLGDNKKSVPNDLGSILSALADLNRSKNE